MKASTSGRQRGLCAFCSISALTFAVLMIGASFSAKADGPACIRMLGFSSGSSSALTATLSIAAPGGVSPGTLLIAQVITDNALSIITAPAGFTVVRSDLTTGTRKIAQTIFAKTATASEPTAYAFLFSPTSRAAGGIVAYGNIDPTNPIDASNGQVETSTTNPTAPSVTIPAGHGGDFLVSFFATSTGVGITPPSTMINRWAFSTAGAVATGLGAATSDLPLTSDSPSPTESATLSASSGTISAQLALLPVTVTGDPTQIGSWSCSVPWPAVGIHDHVLPNSMVLSWADDNNPRRGVKLAGSTQTYLVNIPPGSPPAGVVSLPNSHTNLLCSGHSFLPDGRLFVLGGYHGAAFVGDINTDIFDYRTNTWAAGPDMNAGRWYGSAETLSSGEILGLSGTINVGVINTIPQVTDELGSGWISLTNAALSLPPYPRIHLAPDGRVIVTGPNRQSYFLDTSGAGTWARGPASHLINRYTGSSVMYDVGKILIMGGGLPPTNTAEVIDLNAAKAAWQYTGAMANARQLLNATILADGKVLVTGGTSSPAFNDATLAVMAAEVWDPATGNWSTMAPMEHPRLYHSAAVLLPDGRVLSTGGGRPYASGFGGDIDYWDADFYSPPYLFKGPRPTITLAPTDVTYGQTFEVDTPDSASITAVNFIKLSTTTHAFNFGQRLNHLSFTSAGPNALQVTAPANVNVCPPGHYLLFILNGAGVPSVASVVHID